ncbi:TfoX/Sxy family protein [soil metagenome]
MAYDHALAERLRSQITQVPFDENRMFGGLAILVNGNMACGVSGDDLILRLPHSEYENALSRPGVREFDMTGKPMRGWVVLSAGILDEDAALRAWVTKGINFALTLPPK